MKNAQRYIGEKKQPMQRHQQTTNKNEKKIGNIPFIYILFFISKKKYTYIHIKANALTGTKTKTKNRKKQSALDLVMYNIKIQSQLFLSHP